MADKICVNCKHLAKSSVSGAENWKCMAEQNIIARETDLVTGLMLIKRKWLTCYQARGDYSAGAGGSCGPEALWFEEAPPKFETPRLHYGPHTPVATDLLSQLDKMK